MESWSFWLGFGLIYVWKTLGKCIGYLGGIREGLG